MQRIELKISALSHSVVQSNNYAIVLGEKRGRRRLPIVIGAFEAQAIAVVLENMSPNRPLTHDLFVNSLQGFNINLKHIIISNISEGVFYATLVMEQDGMIEEIDARTSDAIALAVRTKCPIYTYEFIMEQAGVVFEEDEFIEEEFVEKEQTVEELENLLQEAIEEENYEEAAKLRDEIEKRK